MTFSIGFRAPSRQELLLGLLESLALEADPEIRYRDPGLAPQPSPGWIAEDAIDRVQALVRQGLSLDRENIRRWFGRFVTEPKPELEDLRPDNPELEPPELLEAWRESGFIDRAQAARLALSGGDERLWLFADGEAFQLAPHLREAAETLCALHRYPIGCFEPWLGDNDFTDLVTALYRHGAVSLDDD
jgi:50S ribosomal protein L16 3-hydroxylase